MQIVSDQERKSLVNAVELHSGEPWVFSFLRTRAQENRVETLLEEIPDRKVFANFNVA